MFNDPTRRADIADAVQLKQKALQPPKPVSAKSPKKGAFHEYLGKPLDEPITDEDIQRALNSGDPHAVKMANFARNSRKSQF